MLGEAEEVCWRAEDARRAKGSDMGEDNSDDFALRTKGEDGYEEFQVR